MDTNSKNLFDLGYIPYKVSSKGYQPTLKEQELLLKPTNFEKISEVLSLSESKGYDVLSVYLTGTGICVLDIDVKNIPPEKLNNDFMIELSNYLKSTFDIELSMYDYEISKSGGIHIFMNNIGISKNYIKFHEWNGVTFDILVTGYCRSSIGSTKNLNFNIGSRSSLKNVTGKLLSCYRKSVFVKYENRNSYDDYIYNFIEAFYNFQSLTSLKRDKWIELGSSLLSNFSYENALMLFDIASKNLDYPNGDYESCIKFLNSIKREDVLQFSIGNIFNIYKDKVGSMISIRTGKTVSAKRRFDFKELSDQIDTIKIFKTFSYGGKYIYYREVGKDVSVFPNARECIETIIRELDILDIAAKDLITKCITTKHIKAGSRDLDRDHEKFGSVMLASEMEFSLEDFAQEVSERGIIVKKLSFQCELDKYVTSLISNRFLIIYTAQSESQEESFRIRIERMTDHLSQNAKPIIVIVRNYKKIIPANIIYVSSEEEFKAKLNDYQSRLFNISAFELRSYGSIKVDAVFFRAASPKKLQKFVDIFNSIKNSENSVLVVLKRY